MTVSTLDPTPALVVIDLQQGIVGIPAAHPSEQVVANAARLAAAFRAADLPVVLVNVTGGAPGRTEAPRLGADRPADWAELVPELDAQPSDVRVTKQTWGAFTGTSLEAELRARGVTQVVLSGISTSAGVESTARFAHEHGYHVALVTDAMTDRDIALHDHSVQRVFPRLGETGTTEELLALLAAR
ncbi:isochorismatase family protein [Conexibacter sp. JD483]|uniref:isochorismatase family protein n=1 Tax=unclassified Conexibacter TaxID=2627773 RepID=UPI002724DD42|nr:MULTISPECIES: isochorismatase family protein [unclassified Conexibacter]MDO8188783.1 isochorismatase family protein [Conexibacter sp. CPCC 205706]MDO8201854.1 isochorismatase family protein [Conexibacter sp. CPCC 205762]MDR9373060.1 isochorismatase family protein [Conexibacter sp. JD483]